MAAVKGWHHGVTFMNDDNKTRGDYDHREPASTFGSGKTISMMTRKNRERRT